MTDQYLRSGNLRLSCLLQAGKFNAIHMASSRYFSGSQKSGELIPLDHEMLNAEGNLQVQRVIGQNRDKA
jgi:hypothetical protein